MNATYALHAENKPPEEVAAFDDVIACTLEPFDHATKDRRAATVAWLEARVSQTVRGPVAGQGGPTRPPVAAGAPAADNGGRFPGSRGTEVLMAAMRLEHKPG